MIRYPSASNAMDTEVRMLRSSSTSAMIGISPLFRLVGGEVRPRVPLLQRAKQDRNETAGRRMQGLTISNWPRLDEALASNSMNSRHLTCEKARQQQEAQQRSTLSLQDEPRRPTVTRRSVEPADSRQLRDFPDMRDCGACSRRLGQ